MRKLFYMIFLLFVTVFSFATEKEIKQKYSSLKLEGKLDYKIFEKAMLGYEKINSKNKSNILAIIDYTKPSIEERLFIIDLSKNKILFNTLVAHGKNSGRNETIIFSDIPNSFKSSLGFYLTENTYDGKFGYSLRLRGLEEGFNSNAKARNIVIHGADYVSRDFIEKFGFLGRTDGCPALPLELNREIINTIKNGTVVFVIGNDPNYEKRSVLLASL